MRLTLKQPLGRTGLEVPQVVYGTSYLEISIQHYPMRISLI